MVRYSIEIGQQEQDILKEIVLASDKNVKKRKFATGLSSVMAVIMLIYTILCFMNSRIGYGIIGLLFSVFFIWIIINGANTFQKKVINIVHSKMDNKLTSGKREYCFRVKQSFSYDRLLFSYSKLEERTELRWKNVAY